MILLRINLAGGNVNMVVGGLLMAKEKNIDLSYDQACTLDLQDKEAQSKMH
jgi:uncharacterized protein YqfA (UPF0365 family)